MYIMSLTLLMIILAVAVKWSQSACMVYLDAMFLGICFRFRKYGDLPDFCSNHCFDILHFNYILGILFYVKKMPWCWKNLAFFVSTVSDIYII
jgi:hypothetical protein